MVKDKIPKPPYGPFQTAKRFIDKLHNTVLPNSIDRSMMTKMSGDNQTEIISAFRYLGLLGPNDETTESLRELVECYDTDKWSEALGKVITKAYKTIIGDLNIKTATSKNLAHCFKNNAGVENYMAQRSIRFYVAALKESGISYSPHIKAPTIKKPGKGKTKRNKNAPKENAEKSNKTGDSPSIGNEGSPEIPSDMVALPLFPPPRRALIPADLTEADCDTLNIMARAFAKQAQSAKTNKK